MVQTGPAGDGGFRVVRRGQARELIAAFRQARLKLDRLVAALERAGLGDAVIEASVVVDDAGRPVGHLAMTVDGVVRLAELLRWAPEWPRLPPGAREVA